MTSTKACALVKGDEKVKIICWAKGVVSGDVKVTMEEGNNKSIFGLEQTSGIEEKRIEGEKRESGGDK